MLSAAIVEGATYTHLREVVSAGEKAGYPVTTIYSDAARAAETTRQLEVPSFEELMGGAEGSIVRKV